MRRTTDIDAPIPYELTDQGNQQADAIASAQLVADVEIALANHTGPNVIDIPADGIQVGDRFVHLIPAAYELICSCGHERLNVQLSDFETCPQGCYIWDCPSCNTRIEFDGNDIHVSG
jgi:hypothetical protein